MRFHPRGSGRLILWGSLVASLFAACAKGSEIPADPKGPGGANTGGEGGGSGIPPGQIGGPCEKDEDCTEGSCTQIGGNKYCTVPCPPLCPSGTYCGIIAGDSICIPDRGQQCLPCQAAIDCRSPSDACMTAPLGDRFCARDCTTMGDCPNGFTCVEQSSYPPMNGGSGGMDGSGGSGGGAGAGTGGGDAGGKPPPPSGVPYKFCVPNGGLSCPCNDKRDGVTHDCEKVTPSGVCKGVETCNGETGKWEGCTAADPIAEVCNDKDDNCDGEKDNGNPNDLCASEGPPPPNAGWVCTMGSCSIGPCEPGWTQFPPGPITDGCACPVDAGEPNDTCAGATSAGVVTDTAGSSIVITATLSSDTDVDYWTFDANDTQESGTNSYHVSIDITAPNPNDEFLIDVVRGNNCQDPPSGPGTAITTYDWCVDGKSQDNLKGEAPCGPEAAVHCADHSSVYYVRVYRKPGSTSTCTPYVLTITGMGGDPCDFAAACQ